MWFGNTQNGIHSYCCINGITSFFKYFYSNY